MANLIARLRDGSSVPLPPSGSSAMYFTSSDGSPYIKDASGNTTALVGTPTTRNLSAGAGLVGGGDLTTNRTFNVGANADGSVVVNADDIQVGVLATDAQHGTRGGGSLHANAVAGGASGFLAGSDKTRIDNAVQTSRAVNTGNGLSGGGDLSTDRTHAVAPNSDGSITVGAGGVGVGVLASDAQHGNRGGGGLHAAAVANGASGFLLGTDKARIDNAVLTSRAVNTGNGLSGGGDLSADRTHAVVAADSSITVSSGGVSVGVISDPQHGTRSGGTLHAVATQSTAGFLAAADKTYINDLRTGIVNILDYGADSTGTNDTSAAFNSAIAALPGGGGIVLIPAGLYKVTGTITITKSGVKLMGTSRSNSVVQTNNATADVFLVNEWYVCFENFTVSTSVVRTAGYAINAPVGYAYCTIQQMEIIGTSTNTFYNCINASNQLSDVDNIQMRFFSNIGILIAGNSDHRISRVICDNAVQAQAGIRIELTASLLLANCNLIHCGNCLDISPSGTNTIPSIKAVNCFFDTSVNGVRLNPGTGFIYRSEFVNCWMSSHTNAGILFIGANIDGISFENCEVYGNVFGVLTSTTAPAGDWLLATSRVAGNTTAGVSLIGGALHFPQIIACDIGPQAAFGANGTGIIIAAGTYKGIRIDGTKVLGNTVNVTRGVVTLASGDEPNYGMTNSPGINPGGAVTTPTVPASNTVVRNITGFRCSVYLRAGTISAVLINGVATGMTAAPSSTGTLAAVLEPGGSIQITYSVAPTWVWIGM